MPWCKCFDANTIYPKIPFILNRGLLSAWKPKHISFSKYDLFFPKSHILFFWLKVPKNWWSLLEISEWDINSEIWWSCSKDLFSQFGQRDGTCSRPFSRKWILWKSSILKRFIFLLVSEYDNLTGVKTYHDRLKNLGKALLK